MSGHEGDNQSQRAPIWPELRANQGKTGPSNLAHDAENSKSGRDKHVPPKNRRGTLVVPDEERWSIDRC